MHPLVERVYNPVLKASLTIKPENPNNHILGMLSKREQEVLTLGSAGLDNKEIASWLFLGEQAVKNYISAIYSKIGIYDRMKIMRLLNEVKLHSV